MHVCNPHGSYKKSGVERCWLGCWWNSEMDCETYSSCRRKHHGSACLATRQKLRVEIYILVDQCPVGLRRITNKEIMATKATLAG